MATIKVKYRPSTVSGQEGTIYYQIIHDRKVRQISTDIRILPESWDEKRSAIRISKDAGNQERLLANRERIKWDVERLSKIVKRLDNKGIEFSAEDVVRGFELYRDRYTLNNYMQGLIAKMKQQGRLTTAGHYRSAMNSFGKFCNGEDIMLDTITAETMADYQIWLENRGVMMNTVGFYMRILRATYKHAVDNEIIEDRNPFKKVYCGVDKTVKRAISLAHIKKLRGLDLSMEPALDFARDMFLMSFCLRGMSFVDMCFLKKSDLRNGCITYRRRKTGKQLTIRWTKEMQQILDKYPENPTDYLLPILTNPEVNPVNTYRNKGYNINRCLKKLAAKIGVTTPLTLYVARHSWASAAKAKGIPVSVISEGMGHDSEQTTQIYLASLDTSVVDRANAAILKALG